MPSLLTVLKRVPRHRILRQTRMHPRGIVRQHASRLPRVRRRRVMRCRRERILDIRHSVQVVICLRLGIHRLVVSRCVEHTRVVCE